MWLTVAGTLVTAAFGIQAATFQIWGAVRFNGDPLPGTTIEIVGPRGSQTLVTSERGDFLIASAAPGRYTLTATLPGFRTQTREIELTRDAVVDFDLESDVLVEVLWVVPDLTSAYRQADVVARVRIEAARPPEACEDVIAVTHEARVLDLVKGAAPSLLDLRLEGAGACLEGGELVKAYSGPLQPGREYVAFLQRDGYRYEPLAGWSLLFEVDRGVVLTGGQSDLPTRLPLADFYSALQRLAR